MAYRTKKQIKKDKAKARKKKEYNDAYREKNIDKIRLQEKAKEERNRKPIESNIYLLVNSAWDGFVKIGRATDIDNRLYSYQTGSPFRDYEIKFSMKVDDIYLVEKFIYNKYEMLNEWTKADWKDIRNDLIEYNNLK